MKTVASLSLCLTTLFCSCLLQRQNAVQEKSIGEIGADIDEKYRELQRLGHSRERLWQCNENLEEISFDILELSFMQIGEAMRKENTGRQLLEERRLKRRLLHVFNCLEEEGHRSFPENKPSRDLYARFRNLSEELKTQAAIFAFLNRRSEGCFFRDSLQMDSIKMILTGEVMNLAQDALRGAMQKETDELQQQQTGLEQEIVFLKTIKQKIQDRMKSEAGTGLFAVVIGLPLFCLTILLLFLVPAWIQVKQVKA